MREGEKKKDREREKKEKLFLNHSVFFCLPVSPTHLPSKFRASERRGKKRGLRRKRH